MIVAAPLVRGAGIHAVEQPRRTKEIMMASMTRVLAALAVPALAGVALADEPAALRFAPVDARIALSNQQLADDLAKALRTSGRLVGYSIDIASEGGIATLAGNVANDAQRAAALDIARGFPGVVSVEDKLIARAVSAVVPVGFAEPQPPAAGGPVAVPAPMPSSAPIARSLPPASIGGGNPATNGAMPMHEGAPAGAAGGMLPEPAPANAFPGGLSPYSDSPTLPPYAWPSYTPYNNFASMAYQTQHPSGAWPFIGPPHPYPMIPSGWRSVNLRWRRGYWYLRFNAF